MIVLVMIYSVKLAARTVFPVLIVYLFRLEDMVTMKFIDINCRPKYECKDCQISYRTAYRMTPILREGIVKKSLIATLAVQLKLTKFT